MGESPNAELANVFVIPLFDFCLCLKVIDGQGLAPKAVERDRMGEYSILY
jgi:hypothetical protein